MRLTEHEEQLNLQAALASSTQSVAERLCDLVVLLDAEFCVLSNAVPVNSFFRQPMFGQDFREFMDSADRPSLQQAFDRASHTRIPECLPVTVVLGADCRRSVHLLIASTGAVSPKYLVGLSADAEDPGCPMPNDVAHGQIEAARNSYQESVVSDAETTRTGRVFGSADMEQIAKLGGEEQWWIDSADLHVPTPICILGEGGFGTVALGSYHGQSVAVKVMHRGECRLDGALMELRVLRRFRHPNVVLLHGAVSTGCGGIALVYELVCGMQLDVLLESRHEITTADRFQMLYALSSAMACLHLHSPSIVHGDLKPQNIMMEETRSGFRPKLLDFGLSTFQGHRQVLHGGTLAWQAPETIMRDVPKGTASDVYSFGWLALLVVAKMQPHGGLSGRPLQEYVRNIVVRRSSPNIAMPQTAPFRDECFALSAACLRFDPPRRPSMPEIQVVLGG